MTMRKLLNSKVRNLAVTLTLEKCKALETIGGWNIKGASQLGVELVLYGELSVSVVNSVIELKLSKQSVNDLENAFLNYAKDKVRTGSETPFQRLTLLRNIWHKFRLINLELSMLQSIHPVTLSINNRELIADTSVFNAFHAVKLKISISLDIESIEEKSSLSEAMKVSVSTIYGSIDEMVVQRELCRRVALGGLEMLRDGFREISHIVAQSVW